LPEDVIFYLRFFKDQIEKTRSNNSDEVAEAVNEIQGLYEHGFSGLTEKYFSEKIWPDEKVIEQVVGTGSFTQFDKLKVFCNFHNCVDSPIFVILYKELYYRDMYTRMQRGPSLTTRHDSYMNYANLFSEVLRTKRIDGEPVPNEPIGIQLVCIFIYNFMLF
jgi:translation initiation factor 3 subunit L